jgi:hypothetical protein
LLLAYGLLASVASCLFCIPLWYWRSAGGRASGGAFFHGLLFDSHEKLHYVIRLSEFHDALVHGQWAPAWCRNLAGGYGYPFFNFYAPLSYYLADIWHFAGANLFTAWKLHFFVAAIACVAGGYWYARLFYSSAASMVVGLLYLFAPYHIANLYVRGNVAEYTAMSILPFVFGSFHRVIRGGRHSVILAAISFAALILAHNITALFCCPVLLVYLIMVLPWKGAWKKPAIYCVLAGATGILLSAFFWMPAVAEMRFTQSSGLNDTFRETPDHVVYWSQFFKMRWGFGLSGKGRSDSMPFQIGVLHCTMIGAGFLLIIAGRTRRGSRAFAGNCAALFLLMLAMSNWASPLWRIPGFSTIQFPWRLLAFAALFASAAAGFVADFLFVQRWTWQVLAIGIFALCLTLFSWPKLLVTDYFPNDAQMYRPEATRAQFITTNIDEFLPVTAHPHELSPVSHRRVLTADGQVVARAPSENVTDYSFQYSTPKSSVLDYEVFNFPGWYASRDGQRIEVHPGKGGLVEFQAAAGKHSYRVWYGLSPWHKAGTATSAVACILLVFFWVYNCKTDADQTKKGPLLLHTKRQSSGPA